MKIYLTTASLFLLLAIHSFPAHGQDEKPDGWSLDSCLAYALEMNIDVRKADLATDSLDSVREHGGLEILERLLADPSD